MPRCFSMLNADGGASVMLLGEHAASAAAERRDARRAHGTVSGARMKRTPQALLLLAAWVAALAILGWFVQRQLVIGTDLRLFLPSPTTPEQRLLLEEIGEGPASRVLVIALEGAPPEAARRHARARSTQALQGKRSFRFVTNGELVARRGARRAAAVSLSCCRRRSIRSASMLQYLHRRAQARARDLASPAGSFLEPWLPRDPTLELLKVLQRWQPMQEPRREYDVWFDRRRPSRAADRTNRRRRRSIRTDSALRCKSCEQAFTPVNRRRAGENDGQRRGQVLGDDGGSARAARRRHSAPPRPSA